MAARGWWIGCGTLVVIGIVVVVLGVGFFAGRASEVSQGVAHARDRYTEINREFPFTIPANGELSTERFSQYLKVREAVDSAISPLRDGGSILFRLSALTGLPEEVSRIQVDALREQSMSLDEYRWISRQLYTTVVAESKRPDPDPELQDLQRSLEAGLRRGNVGQTNATGGPFDALFIDFTWLKVPEATRSIVREHAGEIRDMSGAIVADTILLNMR